jgi:Zn-dependent peptidase ImmA (M78 family)
MPSPNIKTVVFEWRHPRSKEEAECYGTTDNLGNVSYVFINTRNTKGKLSVNTFFHELTHVFFNFYGGRKVSEAEQEKLAKIVGSVASDIVCQK